MKDQLPTVSFYHTSELLQATEPEILSAAKNLWLAYGESPDSYLVEM